MSATMLGPFIALPKFDYEIEEIKNWVSGASNMNEAEEDPWEQIDWSKHSYDSDSSYVNYQGLPLYKTGIFGAPYQYNTYADVPFGMLYNSTSGSKSIGRVYEENILVNAPIVFFEVGKPLFLDTLIGDKSTTSWVLSTLVNSVDSISDELEKLTGNDIFISNSTNQLRYYSFVDDFNNYAKYVNNMCRFLAIKMGISKLKSPFEDKDYRSFDIRNIKNRLMTTTGQASLASYHIPLYCNASSTSVSESGSNSLGDSMLASTVKSGTELAKELSFILDTPGANVGDDIVKGLVNGIESITGSISSEGISGLFKKIGNLSSAVISGANVMMPLIWKDSSFTKSYTISARLTTPYGDPEAVFNDVYVPLICLLAMTLPRQTTRNGYSSPFIIKCHSKGYFNCDMGMVESIEIKRGGQGSIDWTVNSLPTDIEVTMTIKDLYPAIAMLQAKATGFMFVGNNGLIDYLNMMAGLNLTALDPLSNFYAGIQLVSSYVYNIWGSVEHSINHTIYKAVNRAYNGFLS